VGAIELSLAAIARFRAFCEGEPLVLAAFLGGSFAAGRAREDSDVDVYVISAEADYPELWARRLDFVLPMGELERVTDHPNFEGLGFDLVHFELADGVTGEVAYAHTGNFMTMHGGPHEVFVDRTGLLDGVTFPLL
jgi:predicted nucleotidyltransferase